MFNMLVLLNMYLIFSVLAEHFFIRSIRSSYGCHSLVLKIEEFNFVVCLLSKSTIFNEYYFQIISTVSEIRNQHLDF